MARGAVGSTANGYLFLLSGSAAAQSFCVPALGTCRDGRYPDTWTTTKLSIPPTRPAGPERRTNHRLRKLIDQMQAGIAENRLDLLMHGHRLNELTKEIAELRNHRKNA